MPASEKTPDPLSRVAVALELFKSRSIQPGGNPRQLAISCFRDAAIFIAAAEDIQLGRTQLPVDDSPLDAASAPNLKRTHPINLMSQAWGDLAKVQSTLADLEANPGAEFYEPFGWGKPEINQARTLFPAVVNRARQFSSGK